jgi:mannosidase alpha-like ER degradation enhancer 1
LRHTSADYRNLFHSFGPFADPWYLDVGESMVKSLNLYTKVPGGFASVRDVTTMQLEDHQHSFFLAETCVHFLTRYSFLTYTMQNITLVVISLSS